MNVDVFSWTDGLVFSCCVFVFMVSLHVVYTLCFCFSIVQFLLIVQVLLPFHLNQLFQSFYTKFWMRKSFHNFGTLYKFRAINISFFDFNNWFWPLYARFNIYEVFYNLGCFIDIKWSVRRQATYFVKIKKIVQFWKVIWLASFLFGLCYFNRFILPFACVAVFCVWVSLFLTKLFFCDKCFLMWHVDFGLTRKYSVPTFTL